MTVKVVYGAGEREVDYVKGTTLGELREALTDDLNIDPESKPYLTGDKVGDNYLVEDGDTIEFAKEGGNKG